MKFTGIIPARYASTRLEGKPLADICGHPMIEWVVRRARQSELDDVLVATDDERILMAVQAFGGKALMTRSDHPNGTSRLAEVCESLTDCDVAVNIQGDEPLIEPEMINQLIRAFREDPGLVMATLKHRLDTPEEIRNPNAVKVVTDKNGFALYFSRSPIPYPRKETAAVYYKHIGIYAYKRDFVLEYARMPVTSLESSESLEQLRVLENGYKIKVEETSHRIIGVDTMEELERVRKWITQNKIQR